MLQTPPPRTTQTIVSRLICGQMVDTLRAIAATSKSDAEAYEALRAAGFGTETMTAIAPVAIQEWRAAK